jgi:hypothetical protein
MDRAKPPTRSTKESAPADDHERYESWRYRPDRVPPRSYREFVEHEAGGSAQHGGSRSSVRAPRFAQERLYLQDRPEDLEEDAVYPEDFYHSYVNTMRHYRRTEGRTRLEVGPHIGRGPTGFRRPDERIYEDVCTFLTADGYVDASDISVEVENGEVTLTGSVARRAEKRRAEQLADLVWGVVDVHNKLVLADEATAESRDRG